MLATDVFMKHIRRQNYNSIYEDAKWLYRRIMNGIYELRAGKQQARLVFWDYAVVHSFSMPRDLYRRLIEQASVSTWIERQRL
ncbi:MAG: hypothetical protein LKF48_11240 [Prevotella sp.]|jgi:hypothetical protein|nr:hypothetical protein [Prevotella sp.]MCH4183710.1 hypothetical protein [Prevotella sp.]